MSEIKKFPHTPGPWEVVSGEFKKGGLVAYEIRFPDGPSISMSDALLIAAAPELLAALTLAETYVATLHANLASAVGHQHTVVFPDLEIVRAAIAKATGGAQ